MIIALEEGLLTLQIALNKAGHKTVPLYGAQEAVDAVILCDSHLHELSMGTHAISGHSGVLVLSAKNLSVKEVLNRLEHKSTDGVGLF